MAAYGIADQGDDPNAGTTDMANVSWVCPTIHPDLAIAPEGTPGHSILFRDAAVDARRPTRRRSWPRPSSPRPRSSSSATRRSSRPPGGVPRAPDPRAGQAARTQVLPSPRRAPLDDGFEPAAPPARRTDRRAAASAATVSGGPPWPSARTTPIRDRDFARHNGWDGEFETYDDFDLPTYVGPVDVHEPAVGHRPGRAPTPRGRRRDRRRTVRRRRDPPVRGPVRAARDPRGAVHVGLDPLAPARRRAVRGPDRRRRRGRQHRPGLDRARPRDDLSQGPRGRRDRRDPDHPRRRPFDHLAVRHRGRRGPPAGQHRDRPFRRPRRHGQRRLGRARQPRRRRCAG